MICAYTEEGFFQGYSGELVGNGGFSKVVECQRGPVCVFYDSTTSTGLPALVGFIGGMAGDQWMNVPQVYCSGGGRACNEDLS